MWYRIRSRSGLKRALAGARRQKGISQHELAELLNVDRVTLLHLEAGKNTGAMRLIDAFNALGFDLLAVPRAARVNIDESAGIDA
jgi:transcriptional regulator with XRE-family HTH domain